MAATTPKQLKKRTMSDWRSICRGLGISDSDPRNMLLTDNFRHLPEPPELPVHLKSQLTPVESVFATYLPGTDGLSWLSACSSAPLGARHTEASVQQSDTERFVCKFNDPKSQASSRCDSVHDHGVESPGTNETLLQRPETHNSAFAIRSVENGKRVYLCSACELVMVTRPCIIGHINQEQGKLLKCRLCCEFTSYNPNNIKRHEKACQTTENSSHPPKEPVCDAQSAVPVRTAANGKRIYTCSSCGIKRSSRPAIMSHINQQSTQKMFCDHCQYSTFNPDSFKQHRKSCNAGSFTQLACDECDYIAPRLSELTRHRFVHKNYMLFTCSLCPLRFKFKFNLYRHQRCAHGVE